MRTSRLLILLLGACGACGACGSTSTQTDSGVTSDTTPSTPGFEEDPRPGGASVYLTVDDAAGSSPLVTVWASGLGAVFGLAARLGFDPAMVAAESPQATTWLGPDAAKEARYLAVAGGADVKLGAARRGPAAGEVQVTAATKLATVRLRVLAAGRSRLDLREVQVRRADGSFVPVKIAGGAVTTGGAR